MAAKQSALCTYTSINTASPKQMVLSHYDGISIAMDAFCPAPDGVR